jgi:outer membrane beta-barrel protein
MRALLLIGLLAAPAFAQRSEDEAGDVSEVDKDRSGPLRDRVAPVSGHLFLMKGRFEASVELGISMTDAFYTKYVPSLFLSYHFGETVGVSLRAGYAFNIVSGAAQICVNGSGGVRGCTVPSITTLDGNPDASGNPTTTPGFGRIGLIGDLDLEWAPIYGKLALISEAFLHFNMYLGLGPSFVMHGISNAFTVGGNVHVGFRFFVNRFITVRTELRDVIYRDSSGAGSIRNQLMIDLGISFFLPTDFQRE